MENKIKGLVYGSILGDIVASTYKGKDYSAEYKIKYKDVDMISQDWTSVSDRVIILMNSIANSKEYINIFALAEKFREWQDKGIIELPTRHDRHIGMNLNFVLKQKDYLTHPIKSSKSSYKLMGGDSSPNDALVSNAVCGLSQNWYKNTILHTIITTYDSRCVAACLMQSFIVNCIFRQKPIDWQYINPICQRAIVSQVMKKTPNLIEYNNHLHLALNYKNFLVNHQKSENAGDTGDTAYLVFIKKLNIGNYNENDNQSYVLLGMILAMIIAIDIQHEISAGRYPNMWYFKQRIQETASCGGDATANCSIVGSIIGVFIGFDNLPKEWLQKMNNSSWVDLKVTAFCRWQKLNSI
jgi:ADP-ribosylglycohydrolase